MVDALYRNMFRTGTRRVLQGIPSSAFANNDEMDQRSLDRIDAALCLIRLHDPRRFRRLVSDVQGIFAFGHETTRAASFVPSLRWCVITIPDACGDDVTPEALATTLVHEATHARLIGRGLSYARALRKRTEVLCAKQELAFARRLPDAQELVARIEARVAQWSTTSEEYWSDAFHGKRERYLRDNRVPDFLVRALLWLTRRRAA